MSESKLSWLNHTNHTAIIHEFYALNKYNFTEQLKDALLDAIECMKFVQAVNDELSAAKEKEDKENEMKRIAVNMLNRQAQDKAPEVEITVTTSTPVVDTVPVVENKPALDIPEAVTEYDSNDLDSVYSHYDEETGTNVHTANELPQHNSKPSGPVKPRHERRGDNNGKSSS